MSSLEYFYQNGRLTGTKDSDGNETNLAYDEKGNLIRETDVLGRNTYYTYDDEGNVLTQTGDNGNTITNTYDVKVKKDGVINNMKARIFDSKDKRIDEKILLIAIIGSLEAIKNGGILIDEGEKFIFSPFMCEILKEKGCRFEVINLIERGCELEDIESLIPNKLEKAIIEIKQDAMEILKEYEKFDDMMWVEELV